tara:strand:+ start:215 stop:475 length:261 start_codon:yes stop_codon:yes gene_type:complete
MVGRAVVAEEVNTPGQGQPGGQVMCLPQVQAKDMMVEMVEEIVSRQELAVAEQVVLEKTQELFLHNGTHMVGRVVQEHQIQSQAPL